MATDAEKIAQLDQALTAVIAERDTLKAENAQLRTEVLDPESRATLDRMLSRVAPPVPTPAPVPAPTPSPAPAG